MIRYLLAIAVAGVVIGSAQAGEVCHKGYRSDHGHCVADDRKVKVHPPSHMSASPGPVRPACPPHRRMGPQGQCRPY
jgi:hypothetical protein